MAVALTGNKGDDFLHIFAVVFLAQSAGAFGKRPLALRQHLERRPQRGDVRPFEAACRRVHRCIFQVFGVHFTEALEPADEEAAGEPVEDPETTEATEPVTEE